MLIKSIDILNNMFLEDCMYRMFTTTTEDFTFYVLFAGIISFDFGNEDVILESNSCMYIHSNINFIINSFEGDLNGFKVVFSIEKESILAQTITNVFFNHTIHKLDFTQCKLLECFIQLHNSSNLNNLAVEKNIFSAFIHSLRINNTNNKVQSSPLNTSYIEDATEFMSTQLSTLISLDELSKHIGICPTHLIRIFKQTTNLTPMAYFTKLKINKAITLLISTDLSINEIAEILAFSDTSHFTRTFKKHTTLTPSKYRTQFLHKYDEYRDRIKKYTNSSLSLLETIIDSSPDLIFYKNIKGVLLGCNDAFCKIMGLNKMQIIGKTDRDLFSKEEAAFYYQKDNYVIKTGKPQRNIEWMKYPDGISKKFQVFKAPYYDKNGKIMGIVGISRDITDITEF